MHHRLAIIILNYRTPTLVLGALESVISQVDPTRDLVIVVDNDSGDGSAEEIERAVEMRNWISMVRVVRAGRNGGFAAGNNLGIRSADADLYLLLNSDTIVLKGAIDALLAAAAEHEEAGIIGPRLQWPDGRAQVSAFRYRSPHTEFLRAAGTGAVTRMLGGGEVGLPLREKPHTAGWISFAAVLVRREMIASIGLLDEGFFMYFEDIDYCRRARSAGWGVLVWPDAKVIHLRGGTSEVKSASSNRARLPRYFYESRARYLKRYYGTLGLWLTNLLWSLGWIITATRAVISRRAHHLCDHEGRDNWIGAFRKRTLPVHDHRDDAAARNAATTPLPPVSSPRSSPRAQTEGGR